MGTLNTIQIEGIRMDVGRAKILGRALETMTDIETAIFKRNKLTDTEAKRIWKFMSTCKTLQYLNLSNNVLEFNGAWVVEPLVSSSLLSLQLQKNRIDMKGEQYLFQAIGLNNTLKRIYLKGNKISGISIGEALMTNRSLQFVDLEATKLTEGVLWISTALQTNQSLLILNMNRMNLSNTALLALLEALQSNVHIAYASINGTNVRSMLIREFHEYFTEQSYFKQYKNEISDSERQLILSCNQVEEVSDDESDSDNEFISPSDTVPVPYKEFCLPTWSSDRPNAITLIKECPELVNEVTFGEDLDASHFAMQQKFHSSVEESFDNLAKKHNEANAKVNDLKKSLTESQQEEKKLQDQLKEIKKRLETVSETVEKKEEAIIYHTIKAIRMNNKFNEAVANIETFRAAMRATEQQVSKLREDIKTTIVSDWSIEEVQEFLKQINAYKDTLSAVKSKKICGKILVDLQTHDMIANLKITFNEAKRLQTYLHLIKCGKDIFNEFTGVLSWGTKEVCEWLKQKALDKLKTSFVQKEITGQELLMIDKVDLATIFKIKGIAEKTAFEEAIKELRKEYNPFNENYKDTPVTESKPEKVKIKQEVKKSPPKMLICPLTNQLMTDPVQASDGYAYERKAIEEWLKNNDTSPVTKQPLPSKQVFTSFVLKAMIDEFNAK